MLTELYAEIKDASGPVELRALSRAHQLPLDVIEAMLEHLARREQMQLARNGASVYACALPDCRTCPVSCPLQGKTKLRVED